jgi:hypothetical protein
MHVSWLVGNQRGSLFERFLIKRKDRPSAWWGLVYVGCRGLELGSTLLTNRELGRPSDPNLVDRFMWNCRNGIEGSL